MKAVGATKSLPYHSLARAWIVDALRSSASADSDATADEPQADQLNIKLDQDVLDQLKIRAHELHRPYHRLARDWIESALAREEESLGIDASPAGRPPIKDLMALLLHATNKRGDAAVRGITQLQKLLFVIEEKLGGSDRAFTRSTTDHSTRTSMTLPTRCDLRASSVALNQRPQGRLPSRT